MLGGKIQSLTDMRRKKRIVNLRLRSGGAESGNFRESTCSDHFVKGLMQLSWMTLRHRMTGSMMLNNKAGSGF